jgi:hypothetical protein
MVNGEFSLVQSIFASFNLCLFAGVTEINFQYRFLLITKALRLEEARREVNAQWSIVNILGFNQSLRLLIFASLREIIYCE